MIVTVHRGDIFHMAERHSILRAVTKRTLHRSAAVIAVSGELREAVRDRFGIDERKIHTIHMGVDTKKFRPGLRNGER